MQRESADEHVHGRQLSKDTHGWRVDANFFGCFTQRGLYECFARVSRPTGQADLTGVPGEAACADGKRHSRSGLVGVHEQQRRGNPRISREVTGLPAGPDGGGRETHLRIDAWQRAGQALAQCILNLS
jgi:hypothetical protein